MQHYMVPHIFVIVVWGKPEVKYPEINVTWCKQKFQSARLYLLGGGIFVSFTTSSSHGKGQWNEVGVSVSHGSRYSCTQVWRIASPSHHTPLLFLIIPGNPGIIEYYEEFMRTLYHLSRAPVWGIAHAGHVSVQNHTSSLTDLVQLPPDQFSLQGQIRHKVAFVKQNVPEHVKVVMIGHSIGCYIILKMMDSLRRHHVLRCFMLFPTIERMAVSPRGLYATPFLRYFRWMGVLVSKFLSYFSPHMQYRLILRFFKNRKAPECALNASMNLFDPSCVNNFTFMAMQEMDEVNKLPKELVKKYLSKLSFYYGSNDHWCPKEYFYQMKKRFPHADLQLCEHGYSHAFVLDASVEIAHTVWDWLQGDLHKLND